MNFGLFLLARERRDFSGCGLRFHGRSPPIIAKGQHGTAIIVNNHAQFAALCTKSPSIIKH